MKKPNVLLIISDQHQKKVTGSYGNPLVKTPNIDRLSAEGMTFDQAYCQAPLCGPSRSSAMTGTHPHTCGAYGHGAQFPLRDLPTLGSAFRAAGYVTGSFGKVHIRGEQKEGRDLGFDERDLRYYTYNFQDYIDVVGKQNVDKYWPHDPGGVNNLNPDNEGIDLPECMMFDALVAERSIRFLEEHRDQPFFAWVGLEKPRPAWWAPAEYHAMYRGEDMIVPETFADEFGPELPRIIRETNFNAKHYDAARVRNMTAAYYANTTYLDACVGRVTAAVERLSLEENTIVIYATDHGEMLFDHGLVQKHCFYEAAVAVPLVVSVPGVTEPGSRSDALVGLIDIFPTLCVLAGVPQPGGLEGRPLTSIMEGAGDPDEDPAVFAEFYSKGTPERMVRTKAWKYIYTHADLPQLYDVARDPLERTNLAGDASHAATRTELHARLMDGWEFDPEIHCEAKG